MPQTILEKWEITAEELTEIVEANPSIRGMLFGYVAEHQLRKYVQGLPEVSRLWKEDDHDRRHSSDLYVVYKGRPFSIESKSLPYRHPLTPTPHSLELLGHLSQLVDERLNSLPPLLPVPT
jgi:hypothetical protein